MKKIVGAILIAVGLIGIVYGGLTFNTRKTLVDLGPIHATRNQTHSVPLPPIIGAVALIGGIALIMMGRRD